MQDEVHDEALIRFATVEALENAGFEVLEACNQDEALVPLQRHEIDAVFTHVNMRDTTDGLGLMAFVRAPLASNKSDCDLRSRSPRRFRSRQRSVVHS